MSLTITIPGAVDVTTGSMAPAVLTIGVGVPGAQGPQGPAGPGVPAGGTAGQYLQKTTTGVDYATDWVTLNLSAYLTTSAAASTYYLQTNPAGYITSAALSGYAPLASPVFTGDARAVTPAFGDNDTSIATTAFVQSALLGGTAVARNLEVEVRNQSGSTIAAGSIVYISGATGNKPLITLAQANNDANSAQTIGFVKTSIANNGTGFVIVRGELENIDTSALTEGVQLYLSPTTAGTWTTTKPSAPQHLVYVGIVIRSHPTLGTILVAVQNGYELGEIHDVALGTLANNDLLAYESSTDLWKNKTFSALGLLTSSALTGYALESWVTAGFYPLTGNPSSFLVAADIAGKANLASPSLTGTPLSTTAAADTNTTQIATTAFVVGQASAVTPLVNGTASIGTSLRYARADHVHPTDTTRAPLASPTFTGTPSLPTGTTAVTQTAGNDTTAVATTAFVRADNNVKAWVNFNGTGTPAIRASFNVSSLTDSGVGSYRINFTTAMVDANYVVSGSSSRPGTDFGLMCTDTLLAAYAPVYTMQNATPASLRDNTFNLFLITR